MKILVTGGAGFIASHVKDAFIAEGHDVVVLDSLITGRQELVNPKAKFVKMDIRDKAVSELFATEKFDVVNHHAAQMDVRKSVADPAFDADVNVIGTLNLLENAVKHGVKKFMFASTGGAIYGEQDYFPADENHPQRPLSPYGITKLTTEKYLHFYHHVHGLQYFVTRYANVYGPRQNPHGEAGVVAIFCSKLLAGEQPVINGDGKQTRDYVYIDDVVRANVGGLNYSGSDVVNVGTGVETDVNRLYQVLRDELAPAVAEEHGPAMAGEQQRSVIDYTKASKLLGWKPTMDVETGLRETARWFRDSGGKGR
ncbi:MAG: GDP-mannose 4,6-dehydratase [Lentisphaeria bacterium]|nr:GDP-mannose 4,6-dehydratase [Candidatus Neomarinimicrobiota bacterium]MCF7842650.1 GDP-mannose 4,6-dehydratase [Lentisphaeria bacterium]